MLIVAWWFANSSLFGLLDNASGLVATPLQGLFMAIGLGSMLAINRVYSITMSRAEAIAPDVYTKLKKTQVERSFATFAGIGIGGVVAVFVMVYRVL